ncbi:MAG: hypothetical protein KME50_34040 [Nostoc desertorum CM1-VF14]|jgi:hypothetical protein|nr:hypothetical protein [Nostoc desertorum CM1-VF14]
MPTEQSNELARLSREIEAELEAEGNPFNEEELIGLFTAPPEDDFINEDPQPSPTLPNPPNPS